MRGDDTFVLAALTISGPPGPAGPAGPPGPSGSAAAVRDLVSFSRVAEIHLNYACYEYKDCKDGFSFSSLYSFLS